MYLNDVSGYAVSQPEGYIYPEAIHLEAIHLDVSGELDRSSPSTDPVISSQLDGNLALRSTERRPTL